MYVAPASVVKYTDPLRIRRREVTIPRSPVGTFFDGESTRVPPIGGVGAPFARTTVCWPVRLPLTDRTLTARGVAVDFFATAWT